MQKRVRRPTHEIKALMETIRMLQRYHREGKIVSLVGSVVIDDQPDSPKHFIHSMAPVGRTTLTTGMAHALTSECACGIKRGFETVGLPDPKRIASELKAIHRRAKRGRIT